MSMISSLPAVSFTPRQFPPRGPAYKLTDHVGGTAAGVIFGRLAAADPTLRILMLEMGPTTKDDLAHIQPGRFLTHLAPDSKTIRNVVGKPSEHLNGRQLAIQCGQCVGGGSSVNCESSLRNLDATYAHNARSHDVHACHRVRLRRLGEGPRQPRLGL